MIAMFFGQYLLSKGVIDKTALIDAIESQRSTNLTLPEFAAREGILEPHQAEAILARYRTSDASLWELCLRAGLTPEQLEELTRIQRSGWVRIGTALVDRGHLTMEEVEEHLAEFRELEREADQHLEGRFLGCREPEIVKTCVELSLFHLGRLADRPAKLRALEEDHGEIVGDRRRYAQKLVGDRDMYVALDLPSDLASTMAQEMVGIPLEEGSEAAIDAMCEVVNVIGGNACTRLEAEGIRLRPEPPFSSSAADAPFPGVSAIRASILAGDAELDVLVFV
ncbi:MAG: chemotaxis protein CheX [Thermoanaerobaculales bacterium]